jgi:hypothetical protein
MPKFEAVVRIFAEDNHRKVIDIAETWSSAGSAPIEIEAKDQDEANKIWASALLVELITDAAAKARKSIAMKQRFK